MNKFFLSIAAAAVMVGGAAAFELPVRIYPAGTETVLRLKPKSEWAKKWMKTVGAMMAEGGHRFRVRQWPAVGYMREDRRHSSSDKLQLKGYPEETKFAVEGDELLVSVKLRGADKHAITFVEDPADTAKYYKYRHLRVMTLEPELFKLRPFKGNVHQHSTVSDGKFSPQEHTAYARIAGFDFVGVADHAKYEQNVPAVKAAAGCRSGLAVYPAEELHSPGYILHGLSIGAAKGLSQTERTPEFNAAVKPVFDELAKKYPAVDKDELLICAEAILLARRAKAEGALTVYCHPAWVTRIFRNNTRTISDILIRSREFHGVEIINSSMWHASGAENTETMAQFYDICVETGSKIPVMSSSDSHNAAHKDYRLYFNIFFGENDSFASFKDAFINFRSVASFELKSIYHTRHFGPFKFVRYANFLDEIGYWFKHDELAKKQGELMLKYLKGDHSVVPEIARLAQEINKHRESIYFQSAAAKAPAVKKSGAAHAAPAAPVKKAAAVKPRPAVKEVPAVTHPTASLKVRPFSNFELNGRPVLVPEVQKYTAGKGRSLIPAEFTISAPAEPAVAISQIAAELKRHNAAVRKVTEGAFCRLAVSSKNTPEHPQGYRLVINSGGIDISARTPQGLFYGVQTLRNILRNSRTGDMANCEIIDYPDMDRRGYSLSLRNAPPGGLKNLERTIDLLAGVKMNSLSLEFAETFPYKNNPYTGRKVSFTEEEVRALVKYCRERYIDIAPSLQCGTHTLWMTSHPDWQRLSEGRPRIPWLSSVCISKPEVRKLLEMTIQEQIDMIKPKYFGFNMDEFFLCPFHQCPDCRKWDPLELLVDFFNFTIKIAERNNVVPVMCHDSLINASHDWKYGDALRQRIGRKMNVLYWDYSPRLYDRFLLPFAREKFSLTGHGIAGKPLNVWSMAKMIRNLGSSSASFSYWFYSDRGFLFDLRREAPASLGGFITSADHLWNLSDRHYADMPYDASYETGRRLYPEKTVIPAAERGVQISLERTANAELSHSGDFPRFNSDEKVRELAKTLAALPENFRLMTAPGGRYYGIRLKGRYQEKSGHEGRRIHLGCKAKEIAFLLTASAGDYPLYFAGRGKMNFSFPKVARLLMTYDDDTAVEVPLLYRRNIATWNQPFGGAAMRFAVRGLDDNAMYYSFGILDFVNPHPEKTIKHIMFSSTKILGISPVLLAISLKGAEGINHNLTARRAVPAEKIAGMSAAGSTGAPEVNYRKDFEDGSTDGICITTTGSSLKPEDIKMEIVEDRTAPRPGKVLKITVPPAVRTGKYIRISVNVPGKLPAGAAAGLISQRLSNTRDLNHANEYLLADDGTFWWRHILCDTSWIVDSGLYDPKKNQAENPMKDLTKTTSRRFCYFFNRLDEGVEIYIDDIATANTDIQYQRPWYYGIEPTIFR